MLNSTQLRRLDMVGFYPWEAEECYKQEVDIKVKQKLLDATASDMIRISDTSRESITQDVLETVLDQIHSVAKSGYKQVEVGNLRKYGNVDVDWIIKLLRTKGFDVTIKRTKFMFSDVNSLIIKW